MAGSIAKRGRAIGARAARRLLPDVVVEAIQRTEVAAGGRILLRADAVGHRVPAVLQVLARPALSSAALRRYSCTTKLGVSGEILDGPGAGGDGGLLRGAGRATADQRRRHPDAA